SFFSTLPTPLTSTLFPYTTLFRSLVLPVPTPRLASPKSSSFTSRPLFCFTTNRFDGFKSRCTTPASCAASSESRIPSSRRAACRSEEHTSELQSPYDLVCRLLLEK